MWLADGWKDYEVIDSSDGEKLERWGQYILVRPDPQVIWNTPKDDPLWRKYDARYARSNTTSPFNTVNCTCVSWISFGSIAKISRSSTMKSASLPTSSVPLRCSSLHQ